MELQIFYLVCTRTKRLLQRRYKPGGKGGKRKYHYVPQIRLVRRLASELKISESQVRRKIAEERLYLLRQLYGDEISISDV